MSNYINVPFSTPDITEAEVNAVASVLRSAWITTGAVTKKFESELCKFLSISDDDISMQANALFNAQSSFHDARFDTSALYLAVNKCIKLDYFKDLQDYL